MYIIKDSQLGSKLGGIRNLKKEKGVAASLSPFEFPIFCAETEFFSLFFFTTFAREKKGRCRQTTKKKGCETFKKRLEPIFPLLSFHNCCKILGIFPLFFTEMSLLSSIRWMYTVLIEISVKLVLFNI